MQGHPNIVVIFGVCFNDNLLVNCYNYMSYTLYRVQGHPNIVVIYGVCSNDNLLVMELADSGSLHKVGF